MVDAIRLVLESKSYRVLAAGDGDEGLRKVERHRPDLIVLDIMMPEGTEGFHFVWSLRNHASQAIRHIPIVVVTAIHATTPLRLSPDAPDQDYAPWDFLPVQDFLDKPIEPAEIVRRVERVLSSGPA
ncbi:MAG: response regulator [Chloroflexi bacterium]|nr:response regulator [Chloroflexota bacterium]